MFNLKPDRKAITKLIGGLHFRVSMLKLQRIITIVSVTLIAFTAFAIRILPLRWGAFLSEFDSFWHFYVAERVVDYGFLSIFGWVDMRTWFPMGRIVDVTTPMGLPYTLATLYLLVKNLGFEVALLDVAIFFPPIMAAVACIVIYFLGKDIGGREVGLLSALFLAFNAAYISRTTLGFLKHETIGVLAIVLIMYLFLRAIDSRRSVEKGLFYSVLAGLAIAYLNISWGAFVYVLGVIPVFVIVMVMLRRYSSRLFMSYSIAMGLGLLLAVPFPRPGFEILTTVGVLPVIAGFIVLLIGELIRHLKTPQSKLILTIAILAGVTVGGLALAQTGAISPIAAKIITVLDPSQRSILAGPIVESVAEHRITTWAAFFVSFGSILFLAPLGFFFALKRRRGEDIFLIVFGMTALYFASSFVRLTLIMAPIFALLAAYAFVKITKPFFEKDSKVIAHSRKLKISHLRSAPQLGIILILVLALILAPTFFRSVDNAYTPTTIASSSLPVRSYQGDWLETLAWIQDNGPQNSAILSWWDYGYWIAIGGNSTTIADNATLNTTQIANIGQILLSNETTAFNLSKQYYDTDYILIFVTTLPTNDIRNWPQGHQPAGWGDEGKWFFMADIAQDTHPEISRVNVDKNQDNLPDEDTLLGKMIRFSVGMPVTLTDSEIVFVSSSHQYIYAAEPKFTAQVIILKAT
ncbi:MAG: STT3 domain-containing protein [Candidatus Bathyarchaeota archaeon]